MTIFKYFRWNEYAKSLLLNGELFFNSPYETNDPYEYQAEMVFNGPKVVKTIKALPDDDRAILTAKCQLSKEDPTKPIFEEHKERILKYGICSFSHSYKSPIMWAHYAEQHKGICVGFNVDKLDASGIEFRDVNYRLCPPLVNVLGSDEELIQQVSSKYIDWSYEKEIRAIKKFDEVLAKDDERRKWYINKQAIDYVLLGCKMSPEILSEVSTCFYQGGINALVYHMQNDSAEGGYGLTPVKLGK